MAKLASLKHTYDLFDEALCDCWGENPYFQYFCGEELFQHALVSDRSSLLPLRADRDLARRNRHARLRACDRESLVCQPLISRKAAVINSETLSHDARASTETKTSGGLM